MGTRTVLAVAFAALQLAAVPAFAEGNGPGGTGGAFGGWVVPVGAAAPATGSETYAQSPCYSVAFSAEPAADVGSDASRFAGPAMPLGASAGATYARASGPRSPRG